MKRLFLLPVLFACGLAAGCATQHPIVYPNSHLEKVGHEGYTRDYEACLRLAEEHVDTQSTESEIAEKAAQGAVIGAASGAARGAVNGHGGNAGSRAGAAAVGRGTSGLLGGLFNNSGPPALVRRFVERCLTKKGYDVIGWGKG